MKNLVFLGLLSILIVSCESNSEPHYSFAEATEFMNARTQSAGQVLITSAVLPGNDSSPDIYFFFSAQGGSIGCISQVLDNKLDVHQINCNSTENMISIWYNTFGEHPFTN